MSTAFDPYRKWLGIPPKDQPPNHYRLLGVELFESDPDVISNAADARMAHVRSFQTGPYSELSQKILNEIAGAKVCLLNPEKKAQYDAQLRTQLAAQGLWTPPAAPLGGGTMGGVEPIVPSPAPLSLSGWDESAGGGISGMVPEYPQGQEGLGNSFSPGPILSGAQQTSGTSVARVLGARRRAWQGPAFVALGAAGVVLLVVLVIWMLQQNGAESRQVASSGPSQQSSTKPPDHPSGKSSGNNKTAPSSDPKRVSGPQTKDSVAPKIISGQSPPGPPSGSPQSSPQPKEKESSFSTTKPSEKEPDSTSKSPPDSSKPESSEKEKSSPSSEKEPKESEKPSVPETSSEEKVKEKEERTPIPKRPAPGEAEQTKAAEEIRSLLKEDFAAAEKGGGQKALAEKLLEHALETNDQPAAQYVLFQMAAEWAVRAADATLLQEALDGLSQRFEGNARQMLAAAVEKGAVAPADESLLRARLEMIQNLAEETLAEDDYSAADRLAKAALAVARKCKDADLPRTVTAWAGKIERMVQEYEKVRDQIAKLAQDTNDPEANLAVGRWYAFQVGQWEKALSYLAKGSQAELAEVARQDLQGPQDPAVQQKLGDRWWELSEKASGEERLAMQGRAVYWYEQALPNLTGLSKTSIERRLETYRTAIAQKEPGRSKKGDMVLFFDGQKTYVTVPNFPYDGSKPLTVEVILKADSAKQDGAIVGNMTPAGGWMLALAKDPNRSSSEAHWIFFFQARYLRNTYSEDPAVIGQRVMLAAIYDGQDIRIFVNGRRQYTASSVSRHRPGPPQLLIGASSSPKGGLANFFHGTIEQVRISYIVRYTSNFTPPERLEKDKATELLLHFDAGQGTTVRDLSGARRAARIIAGKWVKRDAANP